MNKKISDFLTDHDVLTIDTSSSVLDAINLMKSESQSYVLVTDSSNVVGIFTERDLLNRVLGENKLPADVEIQDVMTPDPDALIPDDYIAYAVERMARYGYRTIPVQDGPGLNVLTVWDVMMHLSDILADAEESENDREIVEEFTDIGGG
ncbi:MAG: CBS domain-containing protein [Gammaproteobacteria bacterium]|nr:CBS domain-containing protein [Gammaproteobacteria bacterium]